MSYAATLRIEYPAQRQAGVQPILAALRCCPFFAGWSQPALAQLSLAGSLRSFGPGQLVMPEGRRLDHAIVVVRGRLRAVRRADRGTRGADVRLPPFLKTQVLQSLVSPAAVARAQSAAARIGREL